MEPQRNGRLGSSGKMTTTSPASPSPTVAAPSVRSVAMPTEHGGWSLTLEPALLGLLVAWSWPGLALGVAAMVAFLARTPLKLVLVDRWRGRWLARTTLAAKLAAVELAVIAALAVYVAWAGDRRLWVPLAFAAPLIVLQLGYDMRSRSRRLLPEMAGTVGMGSVATAVALAAGADAKVAAGLWIVVAARGGAAVPYVRTQVLRLHERAHHLWHSDLAQFIALVAAAAGWASGLIPAAASLAVAAVAVFNTVSVRLAPRPAKVIGMQQMVFGFVVIAITAVAVAVA